MPVQKKADLRHYENKTFLPRGYVTGILFLLQSDAAFFF